MAYLPIEAKHHSAILSLVAPATTAHLLLNPYAVFAKWTDYLWLAGQCAMLVRPTRTGSNVTLWTVDLDVDAWTRLIQWDCLERVMHFCK
ncbi:MAG: hypothetical protein OHK0046_50470 [Anaerolineae bacterium]